MIYHLSLDVSSQFGLRMSPVILNLVPLDLPLWYKTPGLLSNVVNSSIVFTFDLKFILSWIHWGGIEKCHSVSAKLVRICFRVADLLM